MNVAKDNGINPIPTFLTRGGIPVNDHERPDSFAQFFEGKVKLITESTIVDPRVYNGTRKVEAADSMFMNSDDIMLCVKSIKIKNSEGYDRIPQRVLTEGITYFLAPLTKLFQLIYRDKMIPEQWRMSKIVPIHKKGSKQVIENYRPAANLCSTSKIFERLILNRIGQLESLSGVDLTGRCQHGLKKNMAQLRLVCYCNQ